MTFKAGLLDGGLDGRHANCGTGGCNELSGTAKLCTTSGSTYTVKLSGDVKTWWSTDGAATYLDLNGKPLPPGWVVAFHGTWHGPDLVLANPDNSFTEVFTKEGAIRTVTSTADAGTAHVTLSYGDQGAFTTACRALSGH